MDKNTDDKDDFNGIYDGILLPIGYALLSPFVLVLVALVGIVGVVLLTICMMTNGIVESIAFGCIRCYKAFSKSYKRFKSYWNKTPVVNDIQPQKIEITFSEGNDYVLK
jgi:hypothetical protein